MGTQVALTDLLPGFIKLLKDPEAEVRTATAGKITGVCKILEIETIRKEILPCVKVLHFFIVLTSLSKGERKSNILSLCRVW
jgi:hypothetical protein